MRTAEPITLAAYLNDLEGLWQLIDELLGSLGPDGWSHKHGKEWTYADVPYHLAYFDRDMIATSIERGLNVPADAQRPMRTLAEMNAWNDAKFAQRPAGQTTEQSLDQMRASREAIRSAVAGLSDADLDRAVWIPLPLRGWVTVRGALEACHTHAWNHVMELKIWLKRDTPTLRPAQTHRAMSFHMDSLARIMDREQVG